MKTPVMRELDSGAWNQLRGNIFTTFEREFPNENPVDIHLQRMLGGIRIAVSQNEIPLYIVG